jgi:hypothetical protein
MLARFFRQAWLWSAYWRLYPLWHLLCQAVPEIELPLDPGMRWNIRYRLHRRVIEIRDAQLILRPYSVGILIKLAAAIARESCLSPDRIAAVAEAAVIVSALRSRVRGSTCRHNRVPEGSFDASFSNDMRAEAASLIRVCRAVRHSRIVRQAAGRPPRQVTQHRPQVVAAGIDPEAIPARCGERRTWDGEPDGPVSVTGR